MSDASGATTTPAAPAAPAPSGTPAPAAPPAGTPAPTPTPPPAAGDQPQQPGKIDTSGWPDDARQTYERQQRDIESLRRERGDERINAKNQAAQDGARKALAEAAKLAGLEIPGLTDADEGAGDPKALAQQITQTASERDGAIREAAIVRAAMEARVDPTKLDYLQFQLARDPQVKALDVASADLGAKLRASIDTLVAADATLKLAGTAVASGVENLGGSNGSDTITPEAFARMSIADKTDLYHKDQATYQRLVAAQ